jgi:hypothetical protein
VLRAGYGIYYDRHVLANLNRAVAESCLRAFEQVANGNQAISLFQAAGGGALAAPATGIPPSIFRSDPRLATPYSQQTSFGAEYLVAPNLTASLNYLFVRGVKLSRTRNVNLLPPILLTPQNAMSLGVANPSPQQIGREVFGPGRSNPQLNDIYLLDDSASSTYRGLTVSLHRRMANGLEFVATYTLSKTVDDASDFDEQPQNPFDLRAERAISRQHQQQRFVFNSLWEPPIGKEEGERRQPAHNPSWISRIFGHIELAPIITVGTGRPVDPLVGLDSNRSDAFPLSARPLGLGRNSLQTPGAATVDLRVLKYFPIGERRHLDLVAEFFNLFNHANASAINPFFGTSAAPLAGFSRPIQGVSPRQIQFSLDLEF